MKGAVLAGLLVLAAAPWQVRADAAGTAATAMEQLADAATALNKAKGAADRVAALTSVIRAYETGLAALREGLRQAAIREQALRRGLDAESAQLTRLLAALETLNPRSETLYFIHPDGPEAAIRAGLLLSSVTPELQARVQDLRGRISELRVIAALQQDARDRLADSLTEVQEARAALSIAISNRTDLPRRFADDGERMARLVENADTLAAFAEGLSGIEAVLPEPTAAGRPSALPLPVTGRLLRGFGERDAAGIARPGWLIAAPPRALVTTPLAATIRYAGPLLDYGNVMILEPEPEVLVVLAGLSQVYGAVGTVLPAGQPVGLMGGEDAASEEFIAQSAENGGAGRPETLYLEVRIGKDPVDPAGWFAGNKDENR